MAAFLLSYSSLPSDGQLRRIKAEACKKFKAAEFVKNADIIEYLRAEKISPAKLRRLSAYLKTKHVRSLSGVSVVAIMAKPAPCPGKCIYCPRGEDSPQSYTGFEPATMRARQNRFDSFKMVSARLRQLEAIGHSPEKCELIIMGGTFNSQPKKYQKRFVKRAFDAFNNKPSETLQKAQKTNETAKHRVIGLTIETRPDYASPSHVSELLSLGATRIELGVQTLDDEIYRKVNRRHTIDDVVSATRTCKDAFLKVGYHMMPGLFSSPQKDYLMFEKLFSDDRFKPDMLKIYPCLVMPGTELFQMWKRGEYAPYYEAVAVPLLAKIKRIVPPWVRIMRIERDIPSNLIAAGIKATNLRQMVQDFMAEKGWKCRCIRCREAGLLEKKGGKADFDSAELKRTDYEASHGKEIFLSFEDEANDALFGFLRLRQSSNGETGVRELHVYGESLPIGARKKGAIQHRKIGERLLREAEKISREEFDSKQLLVISGVGARQYYRSLGYRLVEPYMAKRI